MSVEKLIADLSSPNEDLRKNAVDEIYELISANPNELTPHIRSFLKVIRTTSDNYIFQYLGSTISTIASSVPSLGTDYFDDILETVTVLTENFAMDDESEGFVGICAIGLLETIRQPITTDPRKFIEALPTFFKLMEKDHSVKYSAMGYVSPMVSRSPRIFKDYVPQIFDLVKGGMTEMISLLWELYKFNPPFYEENIDFLLQMAKDVNYSSIALMILNEMAKKNSTIMNPYIKDLKDTIHSPHTASSSIMIFSEIARNNPELIQPILPEIQEAMEYNNTLKMMAPNIFGLVGRMSVKIAAELLPFLVELLDDPDHNVHTVTLMEIRNLGEMDRSLLDPYIEKIRTLEDDPQEYIRDQAKYIVDIYEGRTVREFAAAIDDHNKRISEMVHSYEDLKAYVDENVSELKEFISQIAKKLPIPSEFSTEGRIRKTMKLHFTCGMQNDRCLYPSDRSFTAETKAWNKWLKIALSAVKIGAAVIHPVAAGGAVDAVKDVYEVYRTKDDADFISYISQPFLTSEEQDNLIVQLRKARFFDIFNYNAQQGNWACLMCNPPGS
ncbi:MAG: hypothetical protein JSW11_15155 [Candidatus Heimdallarchaeota archaeon]|nr:MAG: hypothetical protein JSW11_15155 [Candidatus Heimdallarchaeota archaeon]